MTLTSNNRGCPVVRPSPFRIVQEALGNAAKHAAATRSRFA